MYIQCIRCLYTYVIVVCVLERGGGCMVWLHDGYRDFIVRILGTERKGRGGRGGTFLVVNKV